MKKAKIAEEIPRTEKPIPCGERDENGLYCGHMLSSFAYISDWNEQDEYREAHETLSKRIYRKLLRGRPWKYYLKLAVREFLRSFIIGIGMTLLMMAVGLAIGYIAFAASGYADETLARDAWIGIGISVVLVTCVIAYVFYLTDVNFLHLTSRLTPEQRRNRAKHDFSQESFWIDEMKRYPRYYEYGQNVYEHGTERKVRKKIFLAGSCIMGALILFGGGWLTYFLLNFPSFAHMHRALLLLMWYAPVAFAAGMVHGILWLRQFCLRDWSEIEERVCPTCHTLHTFVYAGKGKKSYGTYDKIVESRASGEYKVSSLRDSDGNEIVGVYDWMPGYDTHETGSTSTRVYHYVCGKCGQRGRVSYTSHYGGRTHYTYNGR